MKTTIRGTIGITLLLAGCLAIMLSGRLAAQDLPADLQPVTLNTLSDLDSAGCLYRLSDWPASAPFPPDMLLEPGFVGDGNAVYYSPSTHSLFLDDRASAPAQMPSRSMGMNDLTPPPPDDDGTNDVGGGTGGGTGAWATFSYPEGLYFQFIGMTNDPVLGEMAAVGLSGTTNDSNFGSAAGYYLIMSKQDLLATNWWFEGSVQDSDSVGSVSTLITTSWRNNLFLWARAMTNGEDQLVMPLDWQLQNFGRTGVDPNADADGDEISNLQAYLYGISPNVVQFKVSFANNYVNADYANGTVLVTAGQPSEMAIVVCTNTPVWQSFCSQITVPLGSVDGRIPINVGMRGGGPGSRETWHSTAIWRDTVPVQLVLTNPVALSGSRPYIDPAGYTTKALRSLTFQVTNPDSTTSGGNGSVVDRECKPGDAGHTTNWFVCFDAALKLGTNYISIAATDLAGFVAVTNFSYVFGTNGDTQAPSMSLTWPQDGVTVLGSMFTLRGMLDDDAATVTAQWTDPDGILNSVEGQVERGGRYWLDLPLYSGTNLAVTMTSTDAAGNSSTTNLTLFQDDTVFTMNTLSNQLNQAQVNLSGSVSDTTCDIWINGVQGTNNGDGTWSASNVQVSSGGVAIFDVVLHRGSTSLQTSISFDKPPVIYVEKQSWTEFVDDETVDGSVSQLATNTWTWMRGVGSTNVTSFVKIWHPPYNWTNTYLSEYTWPADAGYVPSLAGEERDYVNGTLYSDTAYLPAPYFISAADSGTTLTVDEDWTISWSMTGDAVLKLSTGGKACRGTTALLVVNQGLDSVDMADGGAEEPITSERISLGVYGNEDVQGVLNVWAPNGVTMDISPGAVVTWNYALCGSAVKPTLRIVFNGHDVTGSNVTVFVGQRVALSNYLAWPGSNPPALTDFQWTVPGYAISNFCVSSDESTGRKVTEFPTNNADVSFYWMDGGTKQVQCAAALGGRTNTAIVAFNVVAPTSSLTVELTGDQPPVSVSQSGYPGMGLSLHPGSYASPASTWTAVVLAPTNGAGVIGFTQIGILDRHKVLTNGVARKWTSNGANALDAVTGGVQYGGSAPVDGGHGSSDVQSDTPQLWDAGIRQARANDHFDTYLMYKFGSADSTNSLWVTLKKFTWSWSGTADLSTNGTWSLSNTSLTNTPPVDSSELPEWTGIGQEIQWSPE